MKPAETKSTRGWGRLAAFVLSGLALALVFRKLDLNALQQTLSRARPGWFLAANAMFLAAFCLAAARWHLMLRINGSAVHFGATMRLVWIGHLFNTLLFGPAGGDLAKAGLYARWFGFRTEAVLATCVLDRLAGGAGFLVFMLLAPLLTLAGGKPVASLPLPPASRLAVAGIALAALGTGAIAWRRRRGDSTRAARFIDAFRANAGQLLASPRLASRAVAVSFLTHICMSSLLLLCLQSASPAPFPMLQLLWVFPVITAVTTLPLTFAGTGVREGAALVLLGLYGIPAADAVASALLVFAIYLLWAGVGGLLLWRESRSFAGNPQPSALTTLSAVIPTLNEAEALPETIHRLHAIPELTEILVADGGSSDGTQALAGKLGCRVIPSAAGRGRQLRLGAAAAAGDVIVFVHADTWLPPEAGKAALNALRDGRANGGGYWKVFRRPSPLLRGSRLKCAVRLFLGGRVMGDQAMFVRRDALEQIGGVPEIALMEEFELCRLLRRTGRIVLAGATVQTSARRFHKLGVVRTYLRMARVTWLYWLGASPEKLRRIYERE